MNGEKIRGYETRKNDKTLCSKGIKMDFFQTYNYVS